MPAHRAAASRTDAPAPARIRVGIGGWTFAPWRGTFFPVGLPQRRELEFASRRLTSIEINGTYYGLQKPASFIKWRDETPDDFVFALKAPRFATNRRVLAGAGDSIARFFESGVLELGAKLGPINWQFAPTKAFDPDDFEAFLALLPREHAGRPIRHALEVRHPSFATPAFAALAQRHGAAVVLAADSAYPRIATLTAPFAYLRIMGTQPQHARGYSPAELGAWAGRLRALAGTGLLPAEFEPIGQAGPAPALTEVFVYVISGHKALNPAAACGLIEELDQAT